MADLLWQRTSTEPPHGWPTARYPAVRWSTPT